MPFAPTSWGTGFNHLFSAPEALLVENFTQFVARSVKVSLSILALFLESLLFLTVSTTSIGMVVALRSALLLLESLCEQVSVPPGENILRTRHPSHLHKLVMILWSNMFSALILPAESLQAVGVEAHWGDQAQDEVVAAAAVAAGAKS